MSSYNTDYTRLSFEEHLDTCVEYSNMTLPMNKGLFESNILLRERLSTLEKYVVTMNRFNDASIRALWVRIEKTHQDTLPRDPHEIHDKIYSTIQSEIDGEYDLDDQHPILESNDL